MLKLPLLTLLALSLTTAVATASSPLSGTYRATITGKPAPLNGRWQLRFLPGERAASRPQQQDRGLRQGGSHG